MAQHPPHILHGVCNVLFTIVIPLIENLIMDDLQWTTTTTQQFLGNLGMENLSADDPEKEDIGGPLWRQCACLRNN